ncbi:hypothetical protein QG37_01237 [Candidozyma auris]|uniref:Uncharacterized protein n=1 Tax=Candidozyma auris TaxID=498019 RepID=A0A0L0P6M1_CANAR|nr:hypothetical protein QG37_01237 [[Candida] auris]
MLINSQLLAPLQEEKRKKKNKKKKKNSRRFQFTMNLAQ